MKGDDFRRAFDGAYDDADPEDRVLVEEVARVLDRISELDAAVDSDGLTLAGARGTVAHPALVESRHQRAALAKLLRELRIGLDDGPETNRQRARRGAMSRWHR